MSIPQRFKETATPAGNWMTAGSEETPPTQALNRAAERLGIPLPILATAVTNANAANASGLAASATANVPTTVATSVGNARTAGMTSLLAKGTIVGLSVGIAFFTAIELLPSKKPMPSTIAAITSPPPVALPRKDIREFEPTTALPLAAQPRSSQSTLGPSEQLVKTTSKGIHERSTRDGRSLERVRSGHDSFTTPPTQNHNEVSLPTPLHHTQAFDVPREPQTHLTNDENKTTVASETATPTDIRLAREVKSVDRTRALLKTGDAVGALEELDSFDRQVGYSILRQESTRVRIDVLMTLGRNADATTIARRLLSTCKPSERARLEAQLERKGLSL